MSEGGNIRRMTRDNPLVYRDHKAWVFPRVAHTLAWKMLWTKALVRNHLSGLYTIDTYVHTFFWTRVPLLFFKGRRLQNAAAKRDGWIHVRRWRISRHGARDEAVWNFSFTSVCRPRARTREKGREIVSLPSFHSCRSRAAGYRFWNCIASI